MNNNYRFIVCGVICIILIIIPIAFGIGISSNWDAFISFLLGACTIGEFSILWTILYELSE